MNSFKYILLFTLLNVAIVVSQVSILLLGDSLTVGYTRRNQAPHPYAIQLKKDFEKTSIQADIVVNGQSGDRVVDGRFERRLRESLKQQAAKGKSFDWVVILGGTNDCFNRYKSDKIFAALKNLYLICESSGANVLALTILDFNNDEHEPTRLQINDLIRNYTDPKVTPFDISKPVPIKEKSQSFPSYLLALYLQQLHTNPLRTKAITSGVLSGLQEFVAQELSGTSRRRKGKAKEIDQSNLIDEKILKMALYGFLVSGPLNHLLFEMLNKLFKNRTGDSSKLMQILTSQLIITPIQNTVYLIAMAVIGGINDPAQIRKTVRKSLWPIMKMSWIVSPMAMGFAQRFLPPQLWVPFFNLVGFVFGVIANTKAKKVQQRKLDNKDQDELDD